DRLKVARDRQKSYASRRRKPLEFSVDDKVLLKVSSRKGVVPFGKRSNLSPRYVGPFEIVERIGLVAYRLRNLKKCLADVNLHVPLDEVKVDDKLRFVEEPIEILDRGVKKLKRRWIPIVKVRWNSRRGPEFTWEQEEKMKRKIEAIRLFLAYASFMGFIVYHMDVKSAFLYGTIEEEVYVCQPPSFEDPHFLDKVYKVENALYGLHQASKPIMAGRSIRSNTANDTNPPNETTDEVARQLNTALPNMLTQLVQALGGNQVNQREATPSCSIKTFRASSAKELFKTEEYCPDDEVEKLELEFWNHKMVGSDIDGYSARFYELARLVPHMVTPESQRVNRYIRGLALEIKGHVTSSQPATIQVAVSMANRLTTDGIKDGIFKKKENVRNKKRSNDQNRN
nr:putative reverse transcriptase domain-containing protein [Tanacetum cinerariifolium]